MNEIDDLKAKARDFYWKYTAATTIGSSSDAIAGLDRDAALPRECGQISVPGTEFRVMFLALGVSTAIAGPPLVFVASWVALYTMYIQEYITIMTILLIHVHNVIV